MSDLKGNQVTPGGSVLIEGKAREGGWIAPESGAGNCARIEEHLEPHFGDCKTVMHEILSDRIHLDVLVYPPTEGRAHWLYVTSGMSDLRMTLPEQLDPVDYGRAELIIALPDEWGKRLSDMDSVGADDDPTNAYWPIGLLKWLARYPHDAGTFFTTDHTIPSMDGGPYSPDTKFAGALLTYTLQLPDAAVRMPLPDGDKVNFYGVVLLYPEEMDFKLEKGSDALYDKLDPLEVDEIVTINRPSSVKKNLLKRLTGG